jgi:DNA-binding transcriptional regulator YiaG
MEMSTSLRGFEGVPKHPSAYSTFDPAAYEEVRVAVANRVGTGGVLTLDYCLDRGAMGYPIIPIFRGPTVPSAPIVEAASDEESVPQQVEVADAEPTYMDDLGSIRAVLNPSMSDLARALEVARQSVYDWAAGGAIAPENARKLKELAGVARLFEKAGVRGSNHLLRREIGGRSFYDRFRSGESAHEIGSALVLTARREAEQRDALNRRLKDRPSSTISVEDIGAPHLSEMD